MKGKVLLLSTCAIFITNLACAAFMDLGAGGRPLGMGHAFVGLADDVNAIYYNPAGLASINKTEFTFMYAPLLYGLTDGSNIADYYGAYVQQLDALSAFGAGWLGRNDIGPGYDNQSEMLYQENMFYGSYARRITKELAIGVNLKIPYHQYGEDAYTKNGVDDGGKVTDQPDSTFANGYTKVGLSFDVGLLYGLPKNISVGVMLQDFFSTNLALKEDETDQIPFNFKAGIGYKMPKLGVAENLAAIADISYRIGGLPGDFKFHGGAEAWFLNKSIGVRGGFGAGVNDYADFSLGGSYVFSTVPEIQIDYAWVYPLSGAAATTAGNHRFSCVIRL